jgi:hypothetical protein
LALSRSAADAEISLDLPWDVRHRAGIRAALEHDLPVVVRDALQSVHAIEGPLQAPRGCARADAGVPMVGSCESYGQTRGSGSGVAERLDNRRLPCGSGRDGRADGHCRKRDRGGGDKTDQQASVAHAVSVEPPRRTVAWSFPLRRVVSVKRDQGRKGLSKRVHSRRSSDLSRVRPELDATAFLLAPAPGRAIAMATG